MGMAGPHMGGPGMGGMVSSRSMAMGPEYPGSQQSYMGGHPGNQYMGSGGQMNQQPMSQHNTMQNYGPQSGYASPGRYSNGPYSGGSGPGPGPPYGNPQQPGQMYNPSGITTSAASGNGMVPRHHHLRQGTVAGQTPQQVADSILQMASSSYQVNGTMPGSGPMAAPIPRPFHHRPTMPQGSGSPQMMGNPGYGGMRNPGPQTQYMGYQGSMPPMMGQNCGSPLSPMQVRSPAAGPGSMPSNSPGPLHSPAPMSECSPGTVPNPSPSSCGMPHMMRSPNMPQQSVHSPMGPVPGHSPLGHSPLGQPPGQSPLGPPPIQSPSSCGQPPVQSPLGQPASSPMSCGQPLQSPLGPMPSPHGSLPTSSPSQAVGVHGNNAGLTSPSHYSPAGHGSPGQFPSGPGSNYPSNAASPYNSPCQSGLPGPGGGNPLQSLQKLVMLPESQVVDPKSVVNDACLAADGNNSEVSESKNGLVTDEAGVLDSADSRSQPTQPSAQPVSSGGSKTPDSPDQERGLITAASSLQVFAAEWQSDTCQLNQSAGMPQQATSCDSNTGSCPAPTTSEPVSEAVTSASVHVTPSVGPASTDSLPHPPSSPPAQPELAHTSPSTAAPSPLRPGKQSPNQPAVTLTDITSSSPRTTSRHATRQASRKTPTDRTPNTQSTTDSSKTDITSQNSPTLPSAASQHTEPNHDTASTPRQSSESQKTKPDPAAVKQEPGPSHTSRPKRKATTDLAQPATKVDTRSSHKNKSSSSIGVKADPDSECKPSPSAPAVSSCEPQPSVLSEGKLKLEPSAGVDCGADLCVGATSSVAVAESPLPGKLAAEVSSRKCKASSCGSASKLAEGVGSHGASVGPVALCVGLQDGEHGASTECHGSPLPLDTTRHPRLMHKANVSPRKCRSGVPPPECPTNGVASASVALVNGSVDSPPPLVNGHGLGVDLAPSEHTSHPTIPIQKKLPQPTQVPTSNTGASTAKLRNTRKRTNSGNSSKAKSPSNSEIVNKLKESHQDAKSLGLDKLLNSHVHLSRTDIVLTQSEDQGLQKKNVQKNCVDKSKGSDEKSSPRRRSRQRSGRDQDSVVCNGVIDNKNSGKNRTKANNSEHAEDKSSDMTQRSAKKKCTENDISAVPVVAQCPEPKPTPTRTSPCKSKASAGEASASAAVKESQSRKSTCRKQCNPRRRERSSVEGITTESQASSSESQPSSSSSSPTPELLTAPTTADSPQPSPLPTQHQPPSKLLAQATARKQGRESPLLVDSLLLRHEKRKKPPPSAPVSIPASPSPDPVAPETKPIENCGIANSRSRRPRRSLGLTLQDLGMDNSSEEDKDDDYEPEEPKAFAAVSAGKSSSENKLADYRLPVKATAGLEVKKEMDDSAQSAEDVKLCKVEYDGGSGKTSPVTAGMRSSSHLSLTDSAKKRGRPKGSKDKVERKRKKANFDKCFDAYSDDESISKLRKSLKLGDSEKKKKPSVPQGPLLRVTGSVSNPLTCTVVNTRDCDVVEKGSKRRSEAVYEKSAGGVGVAALAFPLSETVPWLCCFCGQVANHQGLGDLFGPYWPDNYQPDPTSTVSSCPSSPPQLSPAEPFKKKRRRRDSGSVESAQPGVRKRRNSKLSCSSEGVPERWVHIECAVWSHGVYILGGSIHGLEEAAAVAAQTVSSHR